MLTKQELQEATAVILGACGFVTVSIGVAFFTTGLFGITVIKAGDFLKIHQHQLQKAAIDGSTAIGGGIMMSGLGLAIAKGYQNKQSTTETQTKALSENEEAGKKVCQNCRYYNASNQYLACAVQPYIVNTESAANCHDWAAKEPTLVL